MEKRKQYSQLELQHLIYPYRKRILKTTILITICTICVILERFFKEPISQWEVNLLIKLQTSLGITHDIQALPFYILASIQEQYIFLMFVMHYFSVVYFLYDKNKAIKLMLLTYLSWYILMMLQLAYHQPQPFWLNNKIISFMCDQKYGSPGDVTFLPSFIIFYSLFLFKARVGAYIIALCSLVIYCFLVYMTGEIFIVDMLLGLIYFSLIFGLTIKLDLQFENYIKELGTNKQITLHLLLLTFSLFIIALVYYTLTEHYDNINWIQNYWSCFEQEQINIGFSKHYRFNSILGAEPTFCQITILFCIAILGLIDLTPRKTSGRQFVILQLAFLPGWCLIFLQTYINDIDILHSMGLSQLLLECSIFGFMHWWIFSFVGNKITQTRVEQQDHYTLLQE